MVHRKKGELTVYIDAFGVKCLKLENPEGFSSVNGLCCVFVNAFYSHDGDVLDVVVWKIEVSAYWKVFALCSVMKLDVAFVVGESSVECIFCFPNILFSTFLASD